MVKRFMRISGLASLIQALLYVTVIIFAGSLSIEELVVNPVPLIIISVAFILLSLLGLIFVAPATIKLFPKNNQWLLVGKYVAEACLLVTIGYFVWLLFILPNISIEALYNSLIWISWFTFGGMGIFVTIVGLNVWASRILSRGFVLFCAIKTIGFWTILLGVIINDFAVIKIGAVLGGLIGGVTYHTWLGIALYKKSKI